MFSTNLFQLYNLWEAAKKISGPAFELQKKFFLISGIPHPLSGRATKKEVFLRFP